MKFSDLGLCDELLRALTESGYETPTPIQEQAIPVALMGRDILGCAQTGTGKTASFTLPMLEALSSGRARARMPRALILEPTRELAAQVADNFEKYGQHQKLTHALLIGGEFMSEQMKTLERGVDVLIATPGRLIDMIERGKIILNDVKILVIDEADRMLDMGFIPDVEKIAGRLTPVRQTMLFSATMPKEIRVLAEKFLMNPKEISVAPPASPAETVAQKKVMTNRREKTNVLRKIMRGEDINNAIIFCNRKRDVDMLLKSLVGHGFNAAALHGDMVQFKRMETLDRFKKGEVTILVASDVAARGLDIVTVSHVFNYDVPMHADDYVHRIGRTGRAGRSGKSYTLVTSDDDKYLAGIEKLIGREIPLLEMDAPRQQAPAEPAVADETDERPRRTRTRRSKPAADAAPDVAAEAAPAADEAPAVEAAPVAGEEKPARAPRRARRPKAEAPEAQPSEAAKPDAKPPSEKAKTRKKAAPRKKAEPQEKADAQPYDIGAHNPQPAPKPEPRRRGRRDDSNLPGPSAFTDDDTPAFLLRPARKSAAG
jgi:superfamily II DNA/RNA helicase